MNRIPLPLLSGDSPATDIELPSLDWQRSSVQPAAQISTAAVPLMTRRLKPGTSIRRLRHHCSAWQRRA